MWHNGGEITDHVGKLGFELSLEHFEEIEGHRHGDEAGYKLDRKTWEWWSA